MESTQNMPTNEVKVDDREVMITITLSPELLKLPIKSQLNKSYLFIKEYFDSGMGCFEFTKKGNVHYHIKTQDSEFKIQCFFDDIKSKYFKHGNTKYPVYGFIHICETLTKDRYYDYDYVLKSDEASRQMLRRAQIIDKANIWNNRAYVIKKKKVKIDYGNLDPFSDEM